MDAWDELRLGRREAAVRKMRYEYNKDRKSPSSAVQLGITYLWLRDFRAASEHFCEFISIYPWSTDIAYKLAGTAKWCDHDLDAAIAQWKEGIDCAYTDTAGGVSIPMHLYFAAVVQPELMSIEEATELLRTKRSTNWPGPLASFLLGESTKDDVRIEAAREEPDCPQLNEWKIDFWGGVSDLACGMVQKYRLAMQSTSELSWSDYDSDKPELFTDSMECK